MNKHPPRPADRRPVSPWRLAVICPNPAIDVTATISDFAPGDNVADAEIAMRAGGKGTNVACVTADLGATPILVAPLGGESGEIFENMLDARVSLRRVAVRGSTRLCLTLNASDSTSEIRSRGSALSEAEWESFAKTAEDAAASADAAVVSGSFPPNTPVSRVEQIVLSLDCSRVYVDTSGAHLAAAVHLAAADGLDSLTIAPNFDELHSLCEDRVEPKSLNPSERPQHALRWATQLQRRRGLRVLATLGEAGAGLLAEGHWHVARPPEIKGNPVGAGDAALAAFIGAEVSGLPPGAALKRAVAAGASAAAQPVAGRVQPEAVDLFESQTTLVSVAAGQEGTASG